MCWSAGCGTFGRAWGECVGRLAVVLLVGLGLNVLVSWQRYLVLGRMCSQLAVVLLVGLG